MSLIYLYTSHGFGGVKSSILRPLRRFGLFFVFMSDNRLCVNFYKSPVTAYHRQLKGNMPAESDHVLGKKRPKMSGKADLPFLAVFLKKARFIQEIRECPNKRALQE